MKMKQRKCFSGCGVKKRRGYLFSLDAFLAVTIAMTILLVTSYYATKVGGEGISQLQTIRTGSDVLAVLHHKGVLETLDENFISQEMTTILPPYYGMVINITGTADSYAATTNDAVPDDTFIASGERFFITNASQYYHGRFTIWLK